jgi:hypothetical protein
MTSMPAARTRVAGLLVSVLVLMLAPAPYSADAATSWVVHISAGSKGKAAAQAFPAPTNVSASCGLLTATVTWTAVSHASTYSVFQNGVQVATNVVGTSWTSVALGLGSYSYTVKAFVGTNWVSPTSAASNTINIILVSLVLTCG